MTFELPDTDDCVFCSIVAGDAEAKWEVHPGLGGPRAVGSSHDPGVVCFHNQLRWARIMLLVVPTAHMTQMELWSSTVLSDAAKLAVEMGDKYCADDGYRVISNFGRVAHQSQAHGHLHVVSGTSLPIKGADQVPSTPQLGDLRKRLDNFLVNEYRVDETPFAVGISPELQTSQRDLWQSGNILDASQAAMRIASEHSREGFRMISSFDPRPSSGSPSGNTVTDRPGENSAELFLLGGGQLGLYI
ncbi:MAG: HIT family protein [Chloroflexi bacterium]|nr:HIT family protein [Chloroflexota bacterium]